MDQHPLLEIYPTLQNGRTHGPHPLATPGPGDPPARNSNAGALTSYRGPPALFDEEKRRQYCHLLRQGVPKRTAAQLLGVAPRTVQLAIQNDPDLADRVRQARIECHSRAAAQVARAGEKNWRAAAWILQQGKRRRGAGRPRKRSLPFSDPAARNEMKQLVRNVLLEVMPELRQEITAKRNVASPLAQAASAAVESFTADRKAHLAALAAEAKAIRERGESPDLDALWRKHFPSVPRQSSLSPSAFPDLPRNSAAPNAQQCPHAAAEPSPETTAPQQFTTNAATAAAPTVAQNP